jgi:hypothetical protein
MTQIWIYIQLDILFDNPGSLYIYFGQGLAFGQALSFAVLKLAFYRALFFYVFSPAAFVLLLVIMVIFNPSHVAKSPWSVS